MGVAFWGIKRVVVHTILTVPLGQATEPEPLPLPSSPTATTPFKRYMSFGVDQAERTVEGIGWCDTLVSL
jgi:hypothetical protein